MSRAGKRVTNPVSLAKVELWAYWLNSRARVARAAVMTARVKSWRRCSLMAALGAFRVIFVVCVMVFSDCGFLSRRGFGAVCRRVCR